MATDIVMVPLADWKDALDATREKTGKEDLILSGQLGAEIRSISSGGGADDGWPVAFPVGDGNTHILIELSEDRLSPMMGLIVDGANAVTIDWGDGSEPYSLVGKYDSSPIFTTPHQYGKAGKYHITIYESSMKCRAGGVNSACCLLCFDEKNNTYSAYKNAIKKVELGNNFYMTSYGFSKCYGLEDVYISGSNSQITTYVFYYCESLKKIYIPKSVLSIGSGAFSYCDSVLCFDFSNHETVPSLSSASSIVINSLTRIEVPAALAEEWKAATNWSTYADYIVGV